MKKIFGVENDFINSRLDRWIRRNICEIPQSLIEKSIRKGSIKVNNTKKKSSYRLQKNDHIHLRNFNFEASKNKKRLNIYKPTKDIVEYVKALGVPAICFPRGIKNYKDFVNNVKPDVISIDYEVEPKEILKEIEIPIQGGLDPKILLGDKDQLKKEVNKYLEIFKNHPYIFNLGHGVLPETKPEMVKYLVEIVKDH